MSKKQRSNAQPNPAIRLSNLRSRLSQLFAEPDADAEQVRARLDYLTDGLKPASFLPMLVGAFAASPEPRQPALNPLLAAWLQERGLAEPLHELEARHTFEGSARAAARGWLEAAGMAPAVVVELNLADLFVEAYTLDELSQNSPTVFWYDDGRQRRVRGASFLVDFAPPWEGSLKDLAYHSYRDITEARDTFFTLWRAQGILPRLIDATTLAGLVWTALRQNQAQGIMLPADFVSAMPQVVPFISALPTSSAAPALTADELAELTTTGRSPEAIRREERRFGYQTRLPDGSIIRLMRPPDDY